MSDQSQGSPPQGPQGGASAFTEEQTNLIAQIAGQTMNGVWTARAKKLREELSTDYKSGFEGIAKQLAEMSAAQQAGAKPGKRDKDGKYANGAEEESDPKLNGMARQLAEMKAQLDARDKELAGEKAKQKLAALRQSARDELAKVGVDGLRAKHVLASLEADGKLAHDEDGNPVYNESANSVVDLATGIRAWAKTEDAKIFLPPSGARGSGDRPGQQSAPKGAPKEVTDADIGMLLVREFGGLPVSG